MFWASVMSASVVSQFKNVELLLENAWYLPLRLQLCGLVLVRASAHPCLSRHHTASRRCSFPVVRVRQVKSCVIEPTGHSLVSLGRGGRRFLTVLPWSVREGDQGCGQVSQLVLVSSISVLRLYLPGGAVLS